MAGNSTEFSPICGRILIRAYVDNNENAIQHNVCVTPIQSESDINNVIATRDTEPHQYNPGVM